MGRIRGLVALAVAGATLVSGCVTANAADTSPADAGVTIQQDTTGSQTNGDGDDGTVTVTPPTADDTGSTGGANDTNGSAGDNGAGPSAGSSPAAKPGRTAAPSPKTNTGSQARPKAAPSPQSKTKTDAKATPDAPGNRKGSLAVTAQANTSLDGVTVTLYRIGSYPNGMTKELAAKTSWDDLHAVAADDTVRTLAAKAAVKAGVKTSGDPVDAVYREMDIEKRGMMLSAMLSGLNASGAKPTATVTGATTVSLPEGVYLGVPDVDEAVPNLGATTIDGTARLKDYTLGAIVIAGTVNAASRAEGKSSDPAAQPGLLSRAMSLFSARAAGKGALTLKDIKHIPYAGYPYYAGDFRMSDNTGRTLLCVQADANTPEIGATYDARNYRYNDEQDRKMRAVVYYGIDGPGNMFGRDRNTALVMMHFMFSYIQNGHDPVRSYPEVIGKQPYENFKKTVLANWRDKTEEATGIRLLFYMANPVDQGQSLIGWETVRWRPGILSQFQYSTSSGWKSSFSADTKINTTSQVRDRVRITAMDGPKPSDDFFTIQWVLRVRDRATGKVTGTTETEVVKDTFTKDQSRWYDKTFSPSSVYGRGVNNWPANSDIYFNIAVRRAKDGDHGDPATLAEAKSYGYRSYMKQNTAIKGSANWNANKGQYYDHIGWDPATGRQDPVERASTPVKPSLKVTTTRVNASNDPVNPAGDTAPMHDSIIVSRASGNSIASGKDGGKVFADVTLHADLNKDGKEDVVSAAKRTTFSLPSPLSGARQFRFYSEDFVPSDLKGQTKWMPGAKYWFDVKAYGQDANNWNTLALTAQGDHSGVNDPAEQFTMPVNTENVSFSTRALAGTDANPTDPPAISGGTQRVRDRLYAQCTDIPAGTKFTGTLILNWSKDGDATPEASKSKPVSMACGASWSPYYAPADLGMDAWAGGKYWFNLNVPVQAHVPSAKPLNGFDDSAESWTTLVPSVSFATRAQATFNLAGNTTPVSDLIWTGCTNIPDGTTFTGTSTLNVDTDRDGKADHTKSVTVAPKCGRTVASPTVSPKDLGVGDRWPAGFYWWDLNVPKQGRYVLNDTGHAGHGDAKESWTAAASRLMTAGVTSQAANGLVADWNQQDVTRDTKFDSHASSLLIAGGTDPVSDRVRLDVKSLDTPAHRDWDTNNDGRFDGSLRFTVKTTMHLTGGK
ncbi:peptidase, partial [Bifidobacterium margollesii]